MWFGDGMSIRLIRRWFEERFLGWFRFERWIVLVVWRVLQRSRDVVGDGRDMVWCMYMRMSVYEYMYLVKG
jgi:hypothetical protein